MLVNTWVRKEGGCPVESWAQGAVCRRGSPDVYQAYEETHASNQRRLIETTVRYSTTLWQQLGSWVNAICWWRCEAMETLSLGVAWGLCSLPGEQSGVLSGIMSARILWSSISPLSLSQGNPCSGPKGTRIRTVITCCLHQRGVAGNLSVHHWE